MRRTREFLSQSLDLRVASLVLFSTAVKKLKNQTNTKQQILTISNQLHQNFILHNQIQTIKKIHLHCLRCLLRILHSDPRRTQIHSGRYFTWSLLRKQRPVRGRREKISKAETTELTEAERKREKEEREKEETPQRIVLVVLLRWCRWINKVK